MILCAFIPLLIPCTPYISGSSPSNLGSYGNSIDIEKDKAVQQDSELIWAQKSDGIDSVYNSSIPSQNHSIPFPGSLQIPYSGLVTKSISPLISSILDLNVTRGSIVTYVTPGSPAEIAGLRPINITRGANADEIDPVVGDIILVVDGGTIFATNYDSIEQYIFENKKVGDNISLTTLRNGKIMEVEMTIGSLPRFFLYENANWGFKTKYPSDWTVLHEDSIPGKKVVKFVSPENSTFTGAPVANILVSKYLFNITAPLESESKDNNEIGDIRILTAGRATLDKSPAYLTTFYSYTQENEAIKFLTLFAVKNGQLFRIDFSSEPMKYDDYLPLANEMMKSFQFDS